MKSFKHVKVKSLEEAVSLLSRYGSRAAIVAGGSDILGLLKDRILTPELVLSLRNIPDMDYIKEQNGWLKIGALATLGAIEEHELIRERFAALAQAAASAASPQIRNVGTIGGNLCQRPWCWYFRQGFPCFKNGGDVCFSMTGENKYHAIIGGGPSYIVHPSDTAPALVALNARAKILGPGGEKTVPLEEFFIAPRLDVRRENILAPGEVLAEIQVPRPAPESRSIYLKISERQAWDHALVSVAALVTIKDGVCQEARIVLGGVAPFPYRAAKAEQAIKGEKIDPAAAERAGEMAVSEARPLRQNAYKVDLARNTVKRALLALSA